MKLKAATGYGHGHVTTVSLGFCGNAHPTVVVPMLRGALDTLPEIKRWQWSKLLSRCLSHSAFLLALSLNKSPTRLHELHPPRVTAQTQAARLTPATTLRRTRETVQWNSVMTRLRFRRVHEDWIPESRRSSLGVPTDASTDVTNLTQRVWKYFQKPYTMIPWTDEAPLTLTGFQMVFDAQRALARDQAWELLHGTQK